MPRTLYIIRHAQASHEQIFPGDFYRTLDKQGYKEAMEMAAWFTGEELLPDCFISSPAIRAYSTALIFAKQLNYTPENIQLKDAIYDASFRTLYSVLREGKDAHSSIAIFGHNPGLTDLLNDLCGFCTENIPTSGIAAVTIKSKSWNELKSGSGKLLTIEFP